MKILIVDDHQMFANGLAAIFRELYESAEISTVGNGKAALEFLSKKEIDIITTDISMPDMNGIELLQAIKNQAISGKTIVISMHTEMALVKAILKENPSAYLLKNTDNEELQRAIAAIQNGETYYCEAVKNLLIQNIQGVEQPNSAIIPKLSPRELEVLQLIIAEKTTGEIAEELFLSSHTIETYRKNLLRKLEVKNSVGLVKKAYQLGLL